MKYVTALLLGIFIAIFVAMLVIIFNKDGKTVKNVATLLLGIFVAIFVAMLVIVASSQIENPKRVWASHAMSILKTAIFPDQINHFKGDFKFIEELPSFARIKDDRNYNYIVYISKSSSGISQRSQITDKLESIGAHFVAYAWPKRWGDDGDFLLAITESGTLYETDQFKKFPDDLFTKGIPIWNILKNSWDSEVDRRWHQYKIN